MPFKVSHKDLLLPLLASFSITWPLWTAFVAGLGLIIAGCVADARLAILGLMCWIVIMPMIAFMLYFSKVLSPGIVLNLIPHTVRRVDDGYEVRLFRHKEKDNDVDEDAAPEWEQTKLSLLKNSDIVRQRTEGNFRVLYFSDSDNSLLYLPLFPTPDYENP